MARKQLLPNCKHVWTYHSAYKWWQRAGWFWECEECEAISYTDPHPIHVEDKYSLSKDDQELFKLGKEYEAHMTKNRGFGDGTSASSWGDADLQSSESMLTMSDHSTEEGQMSETWWESQVRLNDDFEWGDGRNVLDKADQERDRLQRSVSEWSTPA